MVVEFTRFLFENYRNDNFEELAKSKLIELLPEKEKTPEFAEGFLDVLKNELIVLDNGYTVNLILHVVCKDEEIVNLTPCEVRIVEVLAENDDHYIDFETLSQKVWHYPADMCNIRVNINSIRRKMGPDVIENIKGKGYKLNV